MNAPQQEFDALETELLDLADACLSDSISDEQLTRLDRLVTQNPAARQIYLRCIQDGLRLHCWAAAALTAHTKAGQSRPSAALSPAGTRTRSPILGFLGESLDWISRGQVTPRVLAIAVGVGLSAYFVGLLIMVGLQQAAGVRPQIERSAENVDRSAITKGGPATGLVVARLTEVAGCQWTDGRPQSNIVAGQAFQLLEGIAEFRFSTGTNVAIEGPCSLGFESSSRLAIRRGKLLARVPRRAEGFTVATPWLEVIDLGTEFGVDVAQNGEVGVTVIQGKVDLQPQAKTAHGVPAPVRLSAGQFAQVKAGQAVVVPEPSDSASTKRFERLLPGAAGVSPVAEQSPEILAYYRLGEDDPSPAGKGRVETLPNASSKNAKPLEIRGTPRYTEDVKAPGSRRAVDFWDDTAPLITGPGLKDAPTDNWVLEAWARAEATDGSRVIVECGDLTVDGFGLMLQDGKWQGIFGGEAFHDSGLKCEAGRWTHLALVRDRGETKLYIDGRDTTRAWPHKPRQPANSFTIGGSTNGTAKFKGQIDEVRLLRLRDGFRPEMLLR